MSAFLIILLFSFHSCASFREKLFVDLIDKNNGDYFLVHEDNVKQFLEEVIAFCESFTTRAYMRNIFTFQKKRTKLLTHSFYVITNDADEYHTVSFYGSAMDFYSRGVWVMDSDSDKTAYAAFLAGDDSWDVSEIFILYGIDTEKTVGKILIMMDNSARYYYRDHLANKLNVYNCNTALTETLVER